MEPVRLERRRKRRMLMQTPVQIRRGPARSSSGHTSEYLANDVSLGGLYFEAPEEDGFAVDEVVTVSVGIPEAQTRQFPFARLAGNARIVRTTQLTEAGGRSAAKGIGVALAFGNDLTALSALPLRS